MEELKGTSKQIAWAEQIKQKLIESVNENTVPQIYHIFTSKTKKTEQFIADLKLLQTSNNYLNNQIVIAKIRELIEDETDSKIFIENQTILSFLKEVLK